MAVEEGVGGALSGTLSNLADRYTSGGSAPTGSAPAGSMLEAFRSGGLASMLAGPMANQQQGDPADLIRGALAASVQAVLPTSGFDYNTDTLPPWFPKPLRDLVAVGAVEFDDFEGVYDPYLGDPGSRGDERVYMGSLKRKAPKLSDDAASKASKAAGYDPYGNETSEKYKPTKKQDKTLSAQQAVNMPYTWEDDEVADAMKKFRQAGVNVTDFDGLLDAWGALVDRASMTYSLSAGRRKLTPWDVLELHKREQEKAGTLTDFESGTQTRTYTSVSEVSEGASWQVLQRTLSNLLGRDPSDQEVRDYAYRMNTLAAKNPSITETIDRYKAGEMVSQDRSTTGGFDAGDMAQEAYEQAQDDPEYARVQGGTTYFNALMQAIGAVGDV